MSRLTGKQQRFVEEYLVDLNASAAYRRAGYKAKGNGAEVNAARLLRNTKVSAAVRAAQKARSDRAEIKADHVLLELGRIGLSDVRRLFDEHGLLRPVHELDDDVAAAVASVEVVTKSLGDGKVEYVHKIKLWDKSRALEMLGKHHALFKDRYEHSGPGGGPIEVVTPGSIKARIEERRRQAEAALAEAEADDDE